MKPYKFEPFLKTTIWGGYRIAPFKGIYTAQPNIGESWEISGVPGHESVAVERGLVDDVDVGLNLTQLIDKYKGLLVGQKVYKKYGNKFPLLIKFIDSRQDLSVQVHPDDKLAMERHGCQGKTEMWYIIKSDVGSKIYAGLKKSITPEEYEQLANAPVGDGSPSGHHSPMQDVIATHEAHVGDLYFLPAGRLHAIGAGNFLAEIQETSDMDKLFAEGQSQGGALTVAAAALSGRTFLAIAPAITFMGFFKKYLDKATGMGDTLRLNAKGEMINDSVYNLQGQRLTTRPTKGLYIHNRRSSSPQRVQGWSTVARCGRHRQ